MKQTDNHADMPHDDDLLAAEYALGVLDVAERRDAQARMQREPGFATLVDAWDARFSVWLLRVAPQTPSAYVWPRIRTSLGWAAVGNDTRISRSNARPWKVATAFAAAAAVAAISFAFLQQPPAPVAPAPVVVAPPVTAPEPTVPRPVTVLERDDGRTGWVASIDANAAKLHMAPVPVPPDPQGRVNELWLIPGGGAPISLGVLSGDKTQTIEVPANLRAELRAGATLAVTLEPEAGIPHASPTGPIVAKAAIAQI